jgi:20S proteasome alpha/beta subunit
MASVNKSKMACNKPKRTPGHKTKSHVVKACANGQEKIIRFGQQGVSGAGKKSDAKSKARRASFKARHSKNIKKGKMSAAYWADKVKW